VLAGIRYLWKVVRYAVYAVEDVLGRESAMLGAAAFELHVHKSGGGLEGSREGRNRVSAAATGWAFAGIHFLVPVQEVMTTHSDLQDRASRHLLGVLDSRALLCDGEPAHDAPEDGG
jgi:hypothetical protein